MGKLSITITVFLLVSIISLGLAYYFTVKNPGVSAISLDKYATDIFQKCSAASYKPTCYEEEVPRLMDSISMEQAFEVTRFIQDKDKSYAYCHVLGHKLSEQETAKDPNKWKEIITRCPSGLCSNGCIHGSFQERFRAESLTDEEIDKIKPDLMGVCEPRQGWSPTGLEQGTCYHALGHLVMYITSADLHKSVKLCGELSRQPSNDWSQLCFDGAFMQIFQPLEPEDFVLAEGKTPAKSELNAFCRKFPEREQVSCWSEGWPLFRDEVMTPEGVVNFCSSFLKNMGDQERCYTSMFYVVTAQVQFDIPRMKKYCGDLPDYVMGRCFANVASRLIETDYRNISNSVDMCNTAPKQDVKDYCFNELLFYSTYNFRGGSEASNQLCNSLPDPWKNQCLK